jgi:hypothetical protein
LAHTLDRSPQDPGLQRQREAGDEGNRCQGEDAGHHGDQIESQHQRRANGRRTGQHHRRAGQHRQRLITIGGQAGGQAATHDHREDQHHRAKTAEHRPGRSSDWSNQPEPKVDGRDCCRDRPQQLGDQAAPAAIAEGPQINSRETGRAGGLLIQGVEGGSLRGGDGDDRQRAQEGQCSDQYDVTEAADPGIHDQPFSPVSATPSTM